MNAAVVIARTVAEFATLTLFIAAVLLWAGIMEFPV